VAVNLESWIKIKHLEMVLSYGKEYAKGRNRKMPSFKRRWHFSILISFLPT
jgi:hypothetical protein